MMRILYTFFIHIYFLLIRIAGLFNKKARLFSEGRKTNSLRLPALDQTTKYWFHCASLGEFEQARPVIEKIKLQDPDTGIVITFFSPSGYEIRKHYEFADHICYLPKDTPDAVNAFIEQLKPSKVFFVKYEFWYNLIAALHRRHIPMYLISGIFRKDQYFFKPFGTWFLNHFNMFDHFFVQEESSVNLLRDKGIQNVILAGDTRFDRVSQIVKNAPTLPTIEQFLSGRKAMIIGSNWPEDDKIVLPLLSQLPDELCFIVAPHNLGEKSIADLEKKCTLSAIRYSTFEQRPSHTARILIIDNMGMLSSIYQYGILAYIGGGFGANVHNVLEAATWGLPTIFGPNNKKFHEIQELKKIEAAFEINNSEELRDILVTLLEHETRRKECSEKATQYVTDHQGATEIILKGIARS